MSERRGSIRFKSLKAGRIILNNGQSTLDCTVRNLSDRGAKLSFAHVPATVPQSFSIRFADGGKKLCSIRWRRSLDLGVMFEDGTEPELEMGQTPV